MCSFTMNKQDQGSKLKIMQSVYFIYCPNMMNKPFRLIFHVDTKKALNNE